MSEQNRALMRRWIDEVWNQGNVGLTEQLVAGDYLGHQPPVENHGPEGVRRYFGMLHRAFPDIHFTIEDEIAEGDRVAIRWTARGTNRGEFQGIPPTGRAAVVTGITINRFADGRVIEGWTSLDNLGLLQQLGVIRSAQPAG